MDFSSLKRRDLQTLCKKNNIPANTTNAAMAGALASLPTVEGLDEFLGKPEPEVQGSPEKPVITSPNVPRTTNRPKAFKEELECSKMATRTCCGTRTRAVEGTDTRKTPATRTTRKRACQEASIKKKMEKDLQFEFEADLEQSEVSEDNVLPGGELKDISEEVSEVTVENEGQVLSESQNEVQQASDAQENQEEEDLLNEAQEEPVEIADSRKVDFHSFSRKDLQNLCKKNKIPANMTNAAMADALESLEIVEGLQELMEDYDSKALRSPPMSGITSTYACRSRTTQKITKEEPQSSKLITKSCRGSRRRISDEIEQGKNDVPETPTAPPSTGSKVAQAGSALCDWKSIQQKEDIVDSKSEQKTLNSSVDDRESPASFSNCELEGLDTSEVSSGAEFNISSSMIGDLKEENLIEPEERVTKIDENIAVEEISESSEDTEVFTIDLHPQEVVTCATIHEDQTIGFGGGELEKADVQKSRNLENDADGESEDAQRGNQVTAPYTDVEDQTSKEFVYDSTAQVDQFVSLGINADSNSGNSKLGEMVTFTSDAAVHASPVEIESSSHAEDELSGESESEDSYTEDEMSESSDESESEGISEEEMPEKLVTESTFHAGKSSPVELKGSSHAEDQLSEESESEDSCTEDEMSETSECESESEGITEGELPEKSLTESTNADKSSPDINVESESVGNCTEYEEFDSESTSQDDQASLEVNADSESEKNQLEKMDTTTDSAIDGLISNKLETESTVQDDLCAPEENNPLEILDTTTDPFTGGPADDLISSKVDTDSTTEAESCEPTEKETPLQFKSMRKLKRMLKEKLQAATLAKRVENLTLEETQNPLAKVEGLPVDSECDSSNGVPSVELPGNEEAPVVPQMMPDEKAIEGHIEESEEDSNDVVEQKNLKDESLSSDQTDDSSENMMPNSDVDATTLYPVGILLDNEVVSEDAVTGTISVVACPSHSTPIQISSNTKKKPMLFISPTRTPKSAGRKNLVLDINKENIDNSAAAACKTEPGKIKIAVPESGKLLSAMSMGKLKKEFKTLQHSEKKRQALQSRSGNHYLLSSLDQPLN